VFKSTWARYLVLGFLLAGLMDTLVPRESLVNWLSSSRGIGAAWLLGILLPGGPYVVFPLAGSLMRSGVEAAPLITFVSAKLLISRCAP